MMDLLRPPLLWVVLVLIALFVFGGLHGNPARLESPVPSAIKS
jgi:hypothetical protein